MLDANGSNEVASKSGYSETDLSLILLLDGINRLWFPLPVSSRELFLPLALILVSTRKNLYEPA